MNSNKIQKELSEINNLRSAGIINENEYESLRRDIINGITHKSYSKKKARVVVTSIVVVFSLL